MGNEVYLLGVYGGDLTHAQSAWCSTNRELTEAKLNRVDKLIDKLMSEKHHTPFEKSLMHFLVKSDIASHIHLLKHRIGVSVNAESARYKELGERKGKGDDSFYIPFDWPEEEQARYVRHLEESYRKYHEAVNNLVAAGYKRKRAKESARFYLPYGIQIMQDVTFNMRSSLHFQVLRNSEHAQVEIREIAQTMRDLIEAQDDRFALTFSAFDKMIEEERIMNDLKAVLKEKGLMSPLLSLEELKQRLNLD